MDKDSRGIEKELDQEWVNLMLAAQRNGLHADDIRKFFREKTAVKV